MTAFFNRFWYLAVILIVVALGLLTLANYVFVQENPGGNDFLVHWVGTRALFVDGLSPYSDTAAERIQTLAYGRPAEPGEHELRVAYPLYSVLVFLPYALFSDYEIARALWMTTLEAALVGLAFVSLRLVRWKMSLWLLPIFLIFSILWYHSVRPIINGNAVILVALLIAGAFVALRAGRDELAGVLLAISTIKPHLVVLPIIFVLVWTLSSRRWRTLGWMLISLVLMSAGAALLVPDWPLQNLREIMAYSSYNPPGTPGAVFETWLPATGRQMGWALSVFLGLILLVEWALGEKKGFSMVPVDRQPDPGDQPVDRHPDRSGEFYIALPAACPGICFMGRTLGTFRGLRCPGLNGAAFLHTLDLVSRNRGIRRPAPAAPGDVLPAAIIPAGHIVLGTLVGDQAEKIAGRRAARL